MQNVMYDMLAMLPIALLAFRVRDHGAATAGRRIISKGRISSMIERGRARRAQKLSEQREFRAWLQITANPLW